MCIALIGGRERLERHYHEEGNGLALTCGFSTARG